MLIIDCEHPTVEALWVIRKFLAVVLDCILNFYRAHRMMLPPTINADRYPDGSKDRLRISPLISYYMYPGKKKINLSNSRK
jgi:hypothetical protein